MEPNPPSSHIRVGQSSPLDSLVRRASSRRVKVAKLADALNVPYTSSLRPAVQPDVAFSTEPPHSPLLHTKFRGSVSTYDGSIAGDGVGVAAWGAPSRVASTARQVIALIL